MTADQKVARVLRNLCEQEPYDDTLSDALVVSTSQVETVLRAELEDDTYTTYLVVQPDVTEPGGIYVLCGATDLKEAEAQRETLEACIAAGERSIVEDLCKGRTSVPYVLRLDGKLSAL